MSRRFIVHVGAHKTGTSAFQEWAVRNRAALLDAGFLYPEAGATALGNHAALVSALGAAIEDKDRSAHLLRLFDKELESRPDAAVILSAEMMTTLRFLPHMTRLHRSLADYSDHATAVLVVRDQVEWRNSCYAQAREMLTPLPRFRNYMATGKLGPRSGNWDFLEQHYREAGFGFETLPFDKRVRDVGIVAAMTSLPCLNGLANVTTLERIETNPTVGALALLVAEQVRASVAGPTGTLPIHVRTRLASMIREHAAELSPARFNGFDDELAEHVRAIYRSSNDAFAERNFGTSWQELFPPKAIDHVSADAVGELDADQRLHVRTIAGRVIIEALENGLLQLAPQRPSC
ncbi:hypothetical protein [Sphingomonas mucosissima]|uniref:Uncharacterized protein n=1 Tax=Sphingomonas mucosissima TaxID=370959 RepID=A0A245ZQC2_9SPHN|nr:hypothetical protein [Sphingomonas mucosissima]OWK31934.1 hypothetical protein SPMU_02540 [Sphingomonas mucosissima]